MTKQTNKTDTGDAQATHANIATALAFAQMEMGRAMKDSANPHFKSKYADLASVQDACMGALNRHGIAVIQPTHSTETGERYVVTRFLHTSGETLDCMIPLIIGKNDMQGLGSAITYARRYGLMSLAGIAPEDDDGNAAVASTKGNPMAGAIGDAWKDSVLDGLPENASPEQKAHAFARQIAADLTSKTGLKALDNEWSRREAMINTFADRFPALHETIVDAYENTKNEIEASKIAAA